MPPDSLSNDIKPQLLTADTNPTLRYPVGTFRGITYGGFTYGWLDLSHAGVHFEAVQPVRKVGDQFDSPFEEMKNLELSHGGALNFTSQGRVHVLIYIDEGHWGTVHNDSTYKHAATLGERGTVSIFHAISGFDGVLAQVKAATTPPPAVVAQPVVAPPAKPEPSAPAAPPIIVLTSPSGASPDRAVTVDEAKLVVRGVVMESSGIPIISINEAPANLRPQGPQAAEFWSEPITLQAGDNRVQIVASNSAHAEGKLAFIVHYTPKVVLDPRSLDKPQIISLVHGGVPSSRVVDIIKARGLKFRPTADDLNDIRAAGADEDIIESIQRAATPP